MAGGRRSAAERRHARRPTSRAARPSAYTAARAAAVDIASELAEKTAQGKISGYLTVNGKNGSGGFDHARVEFVGEGANMRAEIVVTEVKDHPNKWVSFEDFSAITDNLRKNWDELAKRLKSMAERMDGLSAEQAQALLAAVKSNAPDIELRLTGTTMVGEQGPSAAMKRLREAVASKLPDATLTKLDVPISDDSLAAMTAEVTSHARGGK